jgi:hypothetical protein
MSAAPAIGIRVYQAALHLYPPAFRREFGVEMARDVREASRESDSSGGWRNATRFWLMIAGDVVMTVPLEWCRTGLPLLALLSTLPGAAFLGMLVRLEQRPWLVVPERVADREILALLLLVTVLLFVILATIMFTLWFARPHPSRRR